MDTLLNRFVFLCMLRIIQISSLQNEDICFWIKPDPRERPGQLNSQPDRLMNIFPTLTVNYTGRLESASFYARRTGEVYLSFWTGELKGNDYNFSLSQKVLLNATTANSTNTIILSQRNITVVAGSFLAIHYPTTLEGYGIIDYERKNNTLTPNVSFYPVIVFGEMDNGWSNIHMSVHKGFEEGSAALHLEICASCSNDTYGFQCTPCSIHCALGICDSQNGSCVAGCVSGYSGPLCTEECDGGMYGIDCAHNCSQHCLDQVACNVSTGYCPNGCEKGYKQPLCNEACGYRQFGSHCTYTCHCKDEASCDAVTGVCSNNQCAEGWQGHNCSVRLELAASRGTGNDVFLAVVILIYFVMTGITTINFFFIFRRFEHKSLTKLKFLRLKDEDEICIVDSKKDDDTNGRPITVEDFHKTLMTITSAMLYQEYMSINKNQLRSWKFAEHPALRDKNMYRNIMPYDDNRVCLHCDSDDCLESYINASYVKGYWSSERNYIAAQGPQDKTIEDFFLMVWQENVHAIVMLTNVVEKMKIKCAQYWPHIGIMTKAGIDIHMEKEVVMKDVVVRHLKLVKDKESRELRQWHYIGWPDHGTPKSTTVCFSIWREVKNYLQNFANTPVVVHCSAGVGRTGTFIALDYLSAQAAATCVIDVPVCVSTLRTYRINMVQTTVQYEFIYRALNQHLLFGEDTVLSLSACPALLQELVCTEKGQQNIQKQFQFLEDTIPSFTVEQTAGGRTEENIIKTRDINVLPADLHRLRIMTKVDNVNDYINAVPIPDHTDKALYAVTQVPLLHTLKDFWRLIAANNIHTIVCLQRTAPEGHEWLPSIMTPLELEEISVAYVNVSHQSESIHALDVAMGMFTPGEDGDVKMYVNEDDVDDCQYANTPTKNPTTFRLDVRVVFGQCTESCEVKDSDFAALYDLIAIRHQIAPEQPIAVVCRNGAEHSGLFIACDILVQMINKQESVDICNVVQIIRARRPQFIKNMEQYTFLHQFVEYITRVK